MSNLLSKIQAQNFMLEPVYFKAGDENRVSAQSIERMYNVLKDVVDKAANFEAFSKLNMKEVCSKNGVGVFSKYCVKPIYTNRFVPTIKNAEILRLNLNGWIKANFNKDDKTEKPDKAEEKHEEVQGVIDFGEPTHVDEMIKDVCVKIRVLRQRGYIFECENGGLTIKKLFTTKIL